MGVEKIEWSSKETVNSSYSKTWLWFHNGTGLFFVAWGWKTYSIEGKMEANYYTMILSEKLEPASVQMGIEDYYIL